VVETKRSPSRGKAFLNGPYADAYLHLNRVPCRYKESSHPRNSHSTARYLGCLIWKELLALCEEI
jgi:hypothetical protein